jgi:hypothetical protein
LEIEAHRAAFRDLTLPAERLDLLAAVVQAMLRGHQRAIEALSKEGKWHRVVMSGVGTERVQGLLPDYREKSIELLVDGALKGVAKLFSE